MNANRTFWVLFYTAWMWLLNDLHPWWWMNFNEWHTKHKPYQPDVHRLQHMHWTHDHRVTQPLQVCNSDLQFGLQTQSPMHRYREEPQWWSTETYSWLNSYGYKPISMYVQLQTQFSCHLSLFILHLFIICTPTLKILVGLHGCKWANYDQN